MCGQPKEEEDLSLPAWERGLKPIEFLEEVKEESRSLRGSVD